MLYKQTGNDSLQCLACAHYCHIPEGQSGLCGVRENEAGELKLLVYGRPCAVNFDPIEKKPLYHFLPGAQIMSLGTFGCNLGCSFCQNWDISQISRRGAVVAGENLSWKKFLETLEYWPPAKVVKTARDRGVPALAYTYNEPTIWSEYAMDIAKLAKEAGLRNVYVSNGYMSPETVAYVAPYLDAINIDLKSFSEDFYKRVCQAKLQPVLNNIRRFVEVGVWVEITTLIIPGENDSDDELKRLAEFIASVSPNIPWHLSAFHGDYQMRSHPATSAETLIKAKKIGGAAGLKYVYVGNVEAGEYGHTFCPECGEILIERGYMSAEIKNLKNGKCDKCSAKIAGMF
ncbi:MAG: AmmeMemoRadiSam system radical SAM enzyme [Patescibacteria group bacterium]